MHSRITALAWPDRSWWRGLAGTELARHAACVGDHRTLLAVQGTGHLDRYLAHASPSARVQLWADPACPDDLAPTSPDLVDGAAALHLLAEGRGLADLPPAGLRWAVLQSAIGHALAHGYQRDQLTRLSRGLTLPATVDRPELLELGPLTDWLTSRSDARGGDLEHLVHLVARHGPRPAAIGGVSALVNPALDDPAAMVDIACAQLPQYQLQALGEVWAAGLLRTAELATGRDRTRLAAAVGESKLPAGASAVVDELADEFDVLVDADLARRHVQHEMDRTGPVACWQMRAAMTTEGAAWVAEHAPSLIDRFDAARHAARLPAHVVVALVDAWQDDTYVPATRRAGWGSVIAAHPLTVADHGGHDRLARRLDGLTRVCARATLAGLVLTREQAAGLPAQVALRDDRVGPWLAPRVRAMTCEQRAAMVHLVDGFDGSLVELVEVVDRLG